MLLLLLFRTVHASRGQNECRRAIVEMVLGKTGAIRGGLMVAAVSLTASLRLAVYFVKNVEINVIDKVFVRVPVYEKNECVLKFEGV